MNLNTIASLSRYYGSFLDYNLARLYISREPNTGYSIEDHLRAAVEWVCKAQDVSGDGGVARSFSMIYHPFFKKKGWIASYPETTGYIIPTFFDYAHRFRRADIAERAIRMADWECRIQMVTGAVQGGTVDQAPTPAIFNTGQVIFGWVRAFQETRNPVYLDSAVKAGRFLLTQQDGDGAWRKALSDYASSKMSFYTYNTRTAWALVELSSVSGCGEFKEAAVRNIEFALTQQIENGWFRSNCLYDASRPLVHTIAYCIRGILETGALVNRPDYIARARKAADAMLGCQRPDGSLAGRFNDRWEPVVSYRCLTGEAQMAGIWGRLYQMTGKSEYLDALKRTNAALRRLQFMNAGYPGVYGGISGSEPIHGIYGRFEILNWAVKFFLDAQMLEQSLDRSVHHEV